MPIKCGELAETIIEVNKKLKPYGLRFVMHSENGSAIYRLVNDNLRPCPFCGGEARPVIESETDGTYSVQCMDCDATSDNDPSSFPCSVESAIGSWNSRVNSCRVCPGPGGQRQ